MTRAVDIVTQASVDRVTDDLTPAERDLLVKDETPDHLSPEDREILNYMFTHMDKSNAEFAAHFDVPVARIHDILARDLREVLKGH